MRSKGKWYSAQNSARVQKTKWERARRWLSSQAAPSRRTASRAVAARPVETGLGEQSGGVADGDVEQQAGRALPDELAKQVRDHHGHRQPHVLATLRVAEVKHPSVDIHVLDSETDR